ncbi:MAG: D-alanyl-D-alanine carboxypeptidase family protein [Armatimonadota bacterium]|nr:D-alanyl-D-alanine carboxypeptidase family protein [Armatimonadota bacterium]MDR7403191.1 D-alanyl-D-alanine carboxypeptidase family protein [Armatimonadota bacterium]
MTSARPWTDSPPPPAGTTEAFRPPRAGILAALVVAAAVPAPAIQAAAAALVDADSGEVLYAHHPDRRWPPASTTKILTALLAAEVLGDDAVVTISPRAGREQVGARVGLRAGQRWRVRDLLAALLLISANDAAVALAEGADGSVEAFVARMNARARQWGLTGSSFVTPHGWPRPGHYSTARDLAILARRLLENERLAAVVRARTLVLARPEGTTQTLVNTNRLLWLYPGADGVKTGWVAESGPCLVGSARRGGRRLVVVLLNATPLYEQAMALLDYGFARTPGGRGR